MSLRADFAACIEKHHQCHPVIYELEPVKNTNFISIFYYFLDLVPKQRHRGCFLSTLQL
ncbi:hypothetical protein RBEMOGI_0653 [Rickettsia bellii str. RML Mogi]|uniref:Uncharacterized protein n=1 Tax=Rickettsia bellii str. RML Mogi TaxID=1359194 RepID=A0A0F3QHG9_RICBE|nr:hypothetical protein RBEMOGI_0653 [Rickettsia bellii str. RML Mogi]